MATWSELRLGELCDAGNGAVKTGPFGSQLHQSDYSLEGTPVVMPKDIVAGRVSAEDVARVGEEHVARLAHHQLGIGDIVYGRRGDIGRCALITEREKGWLCGTGCLRIHFGFAEIDPAFVFYYLNHPNTVDWICNHAIGATMPNLNTSILRSVPVRLPDYTTQRRIASILSAYDDLIENNTRRIAILEEMARRLYEEWFVHFRFPEHEDDRFTDSELGQVPERWDVKTVSDVFEVVGGGTPSKKEPDYWEGGAINWFSPTDLTRAGTSFMDRSGSQITDLGLRKSSARLFPAWSVMMTSRATIGAVAINTTEACTNQGFITCIPNERFPMYLLFHWLHANVETFVSLGTGATFKEITKGTFKTIPLVVPPADLARRFEKTVAPMMGQVLNLQRKNTNLRAQRDLLLPKLVSGEIDVSQAEKDLETAVA